MIKFSKPSNLPNTLKISALLGIVEVFFSIGFSFLGFEAFQMVPYLRLLNVVFVTAFLIQKKLITKKAIYKIEITKSSNNNLLMYWLLITLLSFIVGVIRLNPPLYLVTDFVYILFGVLLYRVVQTNINIDLELKKLENINIHTTFVFFLIGLSAVCYFFKVSLPSFLLVLSLNFALYFFSKKNYRFFFFYCVPFLSQIIVSNRAILIVFFMVLFVSFFNRPIAPLKLFKILIYSVILLLIAPFFVNLSIKQIMPMLSDTSTLKPRLAQISMLIQGRYNWNSPEMLSIKQRFDELFLVVEFWLNNAFTFIFGGGLGATIKGYSFKDAGVGASAILGKENIHNIHILPFSLLFRHGLLGILLFYMLIKKVVFNTYFVLTTKSTIHTSLIFFQVCWIVYSIPAASFLWTCPIFWILLAFDHENKK